VFGKIISSKKRKIEIVITSWKNDFIGGGGLKKYNKEWQDKVVFGRIILLKEENGRRR